MVDKSTYPEWVWRGKDKNTEWKQLWYQLACVEAIIKRTGENKADRESFDLCVASLTKQKPDWTQEKTPLANLMWNCSKYWEKQAAELDDKIPREGKQRGKKQQECLKHQQNFAKMAMWAQSIDHCCKESKEIKTESTKPTAPPIKAEHHPGPRPDPPPYPGPTTPVGLYPVIADLNSDSEEDAGILVNITSERSDDTRKGR